MQVVDEKQWDAINVTIPVPEGTIWRVKIGNRDTGEDFYDDEFPAELPLNTSTDATSYGRNTSDRIQHMSITIEVRDPDNILRATQNRERNVDPGSSVGVTTSVFTVDKIGTWKIWVGLVADGVTVDEKSWTNAMDVFMPHVDGSIYRCVVTDRDQNIEYVYHPPREDFPAEIEVGTSVDVVAYGNNTGEGKQTLKITVTVRDPDNVVRATRVGERTVDPTGGVGAVTPAFTIDKGGMWTIHALLEAKPA